MACADCDDCPFVEDTKGIHEIHISVPVEQEKDFYRVCQEIGVKALSVNFTDIQGNRARHVMTAQVFKGKSEDAYNKMLDIANSLMIQGIQVERRKIEASVSTRTPDYGYFEKHIRYQVEDADVDRFFELLKGNGVKVSYNAKHSGEIPLLTLKSDYGIESLEEFTERFQNFEQMMGNHGFSSVKSMLERCWYDDNYHYDDVWSYV